MLISTLEAKVASVQRPEFLAQGQLYEGNGTQVFMSTVEAKMACVQSLSLNRSQWASREVTANSLKAPIAVVQVLGVSLQAKNNKANYLLKLVSIQVVTRKYTRIATKGESPLSDKTAEGLLSLVKELQKEDPLCSRLLKEIGSNKGYKGYKIDLDSLLKYKNKVVVL